MKQSNSIDVWEFKYGVQAALIRALKNGAANSEVVKLYEKLPEYQKNFGYLLACASEGARGHWAKFAKNKAISNNYDGKGYHVVVYGSSEQAIDDLSATSVVFSEKYKKQYIKGGGIEYSASQGLENIKYILSQIPKDSRKTLAKQVIVQEIEHFCKNNKAINSLMPNELNNFYALLNLLTTYLEGEKISFATNMDVIVDLYDNEQNIKVKATVISKDSEENDDWVKVLKQDSGRHNTVSRIEIVEDYIYMNGTEKVDLFESPKHISALYARLKTPYLELIKALDEWSISNNNIAEIESKKKAYIEAGGKIGLYILNKALYSFNEDVMKLFEDTPAEMQSSFHNSINILGDSFSNPNITLRQQLYRKDFLQKLGKESLSKCLKRGGRENNIFKYDIETIKLFLDTGSLPCCTIFDVFVESYLDGEPKMQVYTGLEAESFDNNMDKVRFLIDSNAILGTFPASLEGRHIVYNRRAESYVEYLFSRHDVKEAQEHFKKLFTDYDLPMKFTEKVPSINGWDKVVEQIKIERKPFDKLVDDIVSASIGKRFASPQTRSDLSEIVRNNLLMLKASRDTAEVFRDLVNPNKGEQRTKFLQEFTQATQNMTRNAKSSEFLGLIYDLIVSMLNCHR